PGLVTVHDRSLASTASFRPAALPPPTAIGGPVHPVARVRRLSIVGLTGSDPDHVRIGRRNSERTNRQHGLFIENWFKTNAVIVRLENAAVSKSNVKNEWIMRINRNIRDATAHHCRSNRARF